MKPVVRRAGLGEDLPAVPGERGNPGLGEGPQSSWRGPGISEMGVGVEVGSIAL